MSSALRNCSSFCHSSDMLTFDSLALNYPSESESGWTTELLEEGTTYWSTILF
jgi:hypothetical protein